MPDATRKFRTIVIILACLSAFATPSGFADNTAFSGVWSVKLCPPEHKAECGEFTLYLAQQGDAICGAHFAATPGSRRIDEGVAPSVTGNIVGSTAFLTIISGRDNTGFRAKAERAGRLLKWRLLDMEFGDGHGYVLAEEATLRKVAANEKLRRISEECR